MVVGTSHVDTLNVDRSSGQMNVRRATPNVRRLRVEIHGAVQGVGFRPFVYRLATELGLTGWVINDTQGVFIEVEGPDAALQCFLERLPAEMPPRAIVQSLETAWLEPAGSSASRSATAKHRREDRAGAARHRDLPRLSGRGVRPGDRRYGYPFTNCTNCGPRFTIIQALPYDRPNTTMRRFILCPDCRAEYENPLDRRFHAQPKACPVCGPRLTLYEGGRQKAEGRTDGQAAVASDDAALKPRPMPCAPAGSSPSRGWAGFT